MSANRSPPALATPLFEATIVPHRSLSTRGLAVALGLLGTLSCLSMTLMWWLGAWPVVGFSGVEITLAILLIRLHGRPPRQAEMLLLSAEALRIVRIDGRGRRHERVLAPAWLNVVLEERAGRVPALLLAARGRREEVGAQLGEAAKRDLARALARALDRLRNPRFDNPQLRG
jgi:uncharacterized membrane protein